MTDLNALLNKANDLFNKKDFKEAAKVFGELIPQVPLEYKAQLQLQKAISHYNGKELSEALNAFISAIDLEDASIKIQALAGKARCLHQLGKVEAAIDSFFEALQLDPKGTSATWAELSSLCNSVGEHKKALEFAKKGLEHQPKDFLKLHTARIVAFFRLENPIEALKDVEDVLEQKQPEELEDAQRQIFSEVCLQQGQLLMNQEKYDEAKKMFDKALNLFISAQTYFLLGVLELRQGNDPGAIAELKVAFQTDRNFWRAQVTLGIIYMRPKTQDYSAAVECFKDVLERFPVAVDANLHYNYGYALYMLHKREEAKSSLQYVYEKDVSNWRSHALLGNIYLEEENWEKVVQYLTAAIENSNGEADATLHYNLAYALMQLNKFRPAEKEFKKAAEIEPTNEAAVRLAKEMGQRALVEEQEQELERKLELERIEKEKEIERLAEQARQAELVAKQERDEKLRLEKEEAAKIEALKVEKAAEEERKAKEERVIKQKQAVERRRLRKLELQKLAGAPQKYRARRPSLEAIPVGNTNKNANKYINWFNDNIANS